MNEKFYKRISCRQCSSKNLSLAIKLNPTPLANNYVKNLNCDSNNDVFPLDVFFCNECKHLQLLHVVNPKILYKDYVYVSGTSPVFVNHFKDYARYLFRNYVNNGLVIDIGSNDGTLLKSFKNLGYLVLGIEPAENIAEEANKDGINTLIEFFSPAISEIIKSKYGLANIITANNVFAHIDDPINFLTGIKNLLSADKGIFVFEVSYLRDVIENTFFDTIYHEHLDYHTLMPLKGLLERCGFEVIDSIRVDTHGGSLRVISQLKGGVNTISPSVKKLIQIEEKLGLHSLSTFKNFSNKIEKIGEELKEIMKNIKSKGKTIVGYGAPAKATTLLYQFDIGKETLDFIVDDSEWKQFLFLPGKEIPIYPKEYIYSKKPDYILILAWNFSASIIKNNQEFKSNGGKFIIPLPNVEIA